MNKFPSLLEVARCAVHAVLILLVVLLGIGFVLGDPCRAAALIPALRVLAVLLIADALGVLILAVAFRWVANDGSHESRPAPRRSDSRRRRR